MKKRFFTYENGVVSLMALTFGALFFDRLAPVYLAPYLKQDLLLNNTQLGILAGGLALAWALSSYFITAWSENRNRNKLTFIAAVVIFSICSIGSGLAYTFAALLVARIIMGIAEGPVIPLAQAFIERESHPSRLGKNIGILQGLGPALFGSILAPIILVTIAEKMGWRAAFYIAGIPGLILGLIAWFYLKPSTTESKRKKDTSLSFAECLKYHNVRWALVLACCIIGWWFGSLPFIADYFVQEQGMSPDEMKKTMGLLGISGLVASIAVPTISDKIGRKRALQIVFFIGILYPFSVYFLGGSVFQLPAIFITYALMGAVGVAGALVPAEAVPDHLKVKTLGLITAVAEIFGGVLIPGISGALSDLIHPSAFLWVSAFLAIAGFIFTFKLKKPEISLTQSKDQ